MKKAETVVMERPLTDADLSKVAAKVIPCGDTTIRRRFAIEYLGIDYNNFKKIAYDHRDSCEEIVYECLQKWREIQNETAETATVEDLVKVFNQVVGEEPGWITKGSYNFLSNYSYTIQTKNEKSKLLTEDKERSNVMKRYSKNYVRLMEEIADLQKEKERLEEDRARVQEKLRIKEEIARAPFWRTRHKIDTSKRCYSLMPNSCADDCQIKKSRSF